MDGWACDKLVSFIVPAGKQERAKGACLRMNHNKIMGRCEACVTQCERGFGQPGFWEDEARGVYAEQMKEFHNISRETSGTHRCGSFIAAAIRDGERFT